MAYIRGARRHPWVALTITPEEEARIETELGPYTRKSEHQYDRVMPAPRPRQPCGTVHGYWSHKWRKEAPDEPCRAAAKAYRIERSKRGAAA